MCLKKEECVMGNSVYMEGALNINTDKERTLLKMDAALLDSVYRQYYKNVYNYIGFRINNHYDAEDLACLVFEKAMIKFDTYNPGKSPIEAWLIGIAKNTVTDYLRSKGRRIFLPLTAVLDFVSLGRQPDEVVVLNEENKDLMLAMSKLKETERQVLSMKFATDLKNIEIADILGLSESNVKVTVHRSVKKLRTLMEKEDMK
jgi:RNA polymerase sigma-70 factor (ECF subfamily)